MLEKLVLCNGPGAIIGNKNKVFKVTSYDF